MIARLGRKILKSPRENGGFSLARILCGTNSSKLTLRIKSKRKITNHFMPISAPETVESTDWVTQHEPKGHHLIGCKTE